ncbi:hypothetical protein KI688_006267 [Linnemannia hyalina]|uniref:Uncharacterized protein n=1 Tax=Linnemannia hyalina TaxID=64524 RepID=A0A9P7Y320_9FUNG|nr:hypothetical protein KI688_006267 [Linnemannia hyalina]
MSVQDLSLPRRTPLQTQLEKIDPSIIRNGFPSTRINRRVTGRLKVDTETALFEVSVLAFREIILNRLWKNDKKFQNESDFCKHQWDILKPRKTLLIECAEVLKAYQFDLALSKSARHSVKPRYNFNHLRFRGPLLLRSYGSGSFRHGGTNTGYNPMNE